MSDFIFAPLATPSVEIEGTSQRFPLGRIFCVGRNYAAPACSITFSVTP